MVCVVCECVAWEYRNMVFCRRCAFAYITVHMVFGRWNHCMWYVSSVWCLIGVCVVCEYSMVCCMCVCGMWLLWWLLYISVWMICGHNICIHILWVWYVSLEPVRYVRLVYSVPYSGHGVHIWYVNAVRLMCVGGCGCVYVCLFPVCPPTFSILSYGGLATRCQPSLFCIYRV